jgi:hypothetical protein
MTNRPNLTEEEKEHYNKVAMDIIYNKTPRTDAFFNRTDITWDDEVKFAQDLEIELNELKQQRNDAVLVATIFEKAYLRLGGRADPYCTSLLYEEAFRKLKELKEIQYIGMEDCCEEPRGMIGGVCNNCGGLVIPEKELEGS